MSAATLWAPPRTACSASARPATAPEGRAALLPPAPPARSPLSVARGARKQPPARSVKAASGRRAPQSPPPQRPDSPAGRGQLGPLSVYARPVEHHAGIGAGVPAWFDSCLRHVITSLDQAPILTSAYEVRGHLSTGMQFVTRPVVDQAAAAADDDASPWTQLAKQSSSGGDGGDDDAREPAAVVYVRELACPAMDEAEPLEHGSVGECCDHLGEKVMSKGANIDTETRYWGLVMQARGEARDGCFILKTVKSTCGSCSCTHFSVSKAKQGVPFEAQLTSAWTTGL